MNHKSRLREDKVIYTVTFNPAIDYVMHPKTFVVGRTNRSTHEDFSFGGKGLDVSAVLSNLNVPNICMGFIAGFSGRFIEDTLHEAGMVTDLIWLDEGATRINIKIDETRINGAGPHISHEKYGVLMDKLERLIEGDTLVLNGSVPSSLPQDTYASIMEQFDGRGIRYVVDAVGDLLVRSLKCKPFLIKPNNHEVGDIFEVAIDTPEECLPYAHKLHEMGAQNVIVSCGGLGSCLVDSDGKEHIVRAVKGEVVNTTGAGDAVLAGFLAAVDWGKSYEEALRYASACGSATAFSQGMATREKIEEVCQMMEEQGL